MPTYPLRAIVLRKTKLGETDCILTMLAADGHQVRAVAKGARKPRSRLGGRVEPLTVLDLLLATGRTLEVISEAETVASHDGLRRDLDRLEAAGVVADVLEKLSSEDQAEPQLYEMGIVALEVMESAEPGALPAIVAAFLLKAMAMHGYRPVLDGCATCGAEGVLFSPAEGGLLCSACATGDQVAMHVTPSGGALMRALMRSRLAEVPALEAPSDLLIDVLLPIIAFVRFHVPARMKALEMYDRGLRAPR